MAGRADDWSELLESDELKTMDDGEAGGELLAGEAGVRSMQERCAAGHAERRARTSRGGSYVSGWTGVTMSYVCPHCHRLPLEDCIWWVSMKHWKTVELVVCGRAAASTMGGDQNRVLVIEDSGVFRCMPRPGACENLGLPLPSCWRTNRRAAQASWDTLFEGFQEQSRLQIMDELRRFIEEDNEGGEDGWLEKKLGGDQSGRGPNPTMSPDAAVREGLEELTL